MSLKVNYKNKIISPCLSPSFFDWTANKEANRLHNEPSERTPKFKNNQPNIIPSEIETHQQFIQRNKKSENT